VFLTVQEDDIIDVEEHNYPTVCEKTRLFRHLFQAKVFKSAGKLLLPKDRRAAETRDRYVRAFSADITPLEFGGRYKFRAERVALKVFPSLRGCRILF
jgi:hypothetical protein